MSDAVISSVLTQLFSILEQQIRQEINLVVGVDKELKHLETTFTAIQTLVADAERRQVKGDDSESIKLWLQRLQDVAYDMDDVLSEWGNALFRIKVEGIENLSTRKKKVFSFFNLPCFCCSRVVCRRDIAIRIQEIHFRLNNIAVDKERYHFAVNSNWNERRQNDRAITTSFVDESKVRGRDRDRDVLVREILNYGNEIESKGYETVSVVGTGGIGKTTLAGLAYNSEEVVNFFDVRVWICVSEPPFDDELRVAKAILEHLEGSAPNLFELETVLGRLSMLVKGEKFLFVMDDVWIEDSRKWESLRNALNCGGEGSKVLITTRKVRTAEVMESRYILRLEGLSEEDCWQLFSQIAFHERKDREKEELEVYGREIAKKCKGLPLATRIMGNFLRFKTSVQDWRNVLESDMWGLEDTKDIFPPLLLSYYDLIPPIKNCFLYCANFPQDFEIDGDNLIKLWMAQGCLGLDGNTDLEGKGKEYLETLISRSFFQTQKREDKGRFSNQLRMHDMVLNLAQFLRKHESLVMEVKSDLVHPHSSSDVKVRHLTLIRSEDSPFPDSIKHTESLHSFWVQSFYDSPRIVSQIDRISPKFFQHSVHLKSLDLSRNRLIDLPSDIEKLQNLRFLNLSYNPLNELPEKVCVLYKLQTLKLVACNQLTSLPGEINKLKDLRHLEINKTDSLNALPVGIAELTALRTLSKFVLTGNGDSTLSDLSNLNQLRGSIEILGLGHVASGADAEKAKLEKKEHLTDVHLDFQPQSQTPHLAEEVAEALALNPNLQSLHISSYNGTRLPGWITTLTKLTKLRVSDCPNCINLPALGTQLPLLESLCLERMQNLKMLGDENYGLAMFANLRKLKLSSLNNVEEWNIIINDDMPKLQYLKVSDCKKMKVLPDSLLSKPSLRKLYISNSPLLQQKYNKKSGEHWKKVCHIAKVKI